MISHPAAWQRAWRLREAHFPLEIAFARPSRTAAISVTGAECALNCPHCQGRYLRGMTPIWQVQPTEATSCLISGGCDSQGRVPVRPHLDQLRQLAQGRRLNWHVGFISEEDMAEIAPLVDVVSFDMVGDEATIRQVYGLPYSVDDYIAAYRMIGRYARVVPHITIGLHGGRVLGEREAIKRLQEAGLSALVFIILIPTRGTAYEHCRPPPPDQVGDLLAFARHTLPDTPLYLGCMRPGGSYRDAVDPIAVQVGVNKIVNPSPAAVSLARRLGLRVRWEDECCVLGH